MNEPVAWMYQIHDITGWTWVFSQSLPDYEYRNEKPLYTHPVKELTDEEITELKNALRGSEYKTYPSKKQWESYLVLEKYAERLLRKAKNV